MRRLLVHRTYLARRFNSVTAFDPERVAEQRDVVIVGGGPAGLAAAIRLKQLAEAKQQEISVCVVEKASEIGGHILSGAAIEPKSLDELIPEWRTLNSPLKTEVARDKLMFLTERSSFSVPLIPQLNNHGCYIGSLSQVVRWLGQIAEEKGVEIYPGIAASEILYDERGIVRGIATNDVGIAKDGSKKDSFARGMELHGKLTLFAEGCRGHLTNRLFEKFHLRANAQPQTYGIGIKEVWRVDPKKHELGLVMHTMGWPMDWQTYGGSFMYHWDDHQVSLGFVVALDYQNPYLNPYKEFQRWKHHPLIKQCLEGGECISYGARAISEGGYQAIPKLVFPGGALIGDCAGFLNVPKIKGTHTAIKSGMLAAESVIDALGDPDSEFEKGYVLSKYPESFKKSWLHEELHQVRNFRPSFKYGLWKGLLLAGLDTIFLRGKAPWTLSHDHEDSTTLKPAAQCKPINYPPPDGVISFDLLTNVSRTNTFHEEDQPCHLTLKDPKYQLNVSLDKFAGPEQRFCPAGVYEYVDDENGKKKFQINQSNCIHCKTCDIKVDNIVWVTPEGGGGPAYSNT